MVRPVRRPSTWTATVPLVLFLLTTIVVHPALATAAADSPSRSGANASLPSTSGTTAGLPMTSGTTASLHSTSGATAGLPSSAEKTAAFRLLASTGSTREESIFRQLDPLKRAGVLMTLLGLVILGLGLIVVVSLGARYVRRISRRAKPTKDETVDDWFAKPLAPDIVDRHDHDGR